MNTLIYFLFLQLLCILNINADPLLRISQGILDGTKEISKNGRTYSAFLGIPYGKPPVGNLRFKNPEPAEGWIGVRSAKSFGNICPQSGRGRSVIGNEDCLFLNVYTPIIDFNTIDNNQLLPVMFWIHGGGFTTGSSNIYGAQFLLDKNIILVTINYRLGMLGFISTADLVATGNYGLKDQVLALKWVQQNIKSFGGDPQRVTIFGQSAGAASVGYHAISQASTGLFSAYIIQSGALISPWAFQTREMLASYTRRASGRVFCISRNTRNLVECLRSKSAASLVNADSIFDSFQRSALLNWTPTNEPENDNAFLTDSPKNLINNNAIKDLPVLSGATSDEGLLITQVLYKNDFLYGWYKLNANSLIDRYSKRYLEIEDSRQFTAEVTRFYFNGSILSSTKQEFLHSLTRFITDGFFLHPQIRMLEKVTPSMRNSNFFYNFGYRGSMSTTMMTGNNENIGVAHADELIYLFPITLGDLKTSHLNFTANDDYISRTMIDMWTSFATNRKPVSNVLTNPNLWTPYTTQNPAHIQIGNILNNKDPLITISNTYYTQRMNFWRTYAPL